MTMPGKDEKCLGGHAIMAVGYDDEKKYLLLEIVGELNGVIKDTFICLMNLF